VALVAPIADFTVSVGLNRHILRQGSVVDALQHDTTLSEEAKADLEVMEQAVDTEPVEVKPENNIDGKLILAEEVQLGKVKWSAGDSPALFQRQLTQ
jgi:hypothetical protein